MLRELRKQQLKDQIYEKAMQLIAAKGYDNVTVDEIVRECGVAKGTFFNYFPKKEHLLLHLGQSQLELFEQIIEENVGGEEPKVCISAMFEKLLSRYREDSELLRLVLSETIRSALLMQEETRHIEVFKKKLAEYIDQAKHKGQLNSRFPSRSISSVLVAIYLNTLLTEMTDRDANGNTHNDDRFVKFQQQLDLVWEGIASN